MKEKWTQKGRVVWMDDVGIAVITEIDAAAIVTTHNSAVKQIKAKAVKAAVKAAGRDWMRALAKRRRKGLR